MKSPVNNLLALLIATFLIFGCAVTPRGSTWDSPQRFTKAQVFNASLQAGGQNGMITTASDRESGTMSFSKKIGKGDMILSVQLSDTNGIIQVRTTGNYGGGLAISGLHEEVIQNFHVFLFRNLGITSASEKNVTVTQVK